MADAHVIHVKPAGSASAFAAEQEEQLVAMLRSTASELLAVWAQEGLPPAEQAAQLQGLRSQLLELLTAKVKDEKDMFNKYVEDVDRLRGEIERMANSIGASVDWQEPSDPEALLPKLARLQSVRSDVEQQCNARRQRLSELCEKLQELHAQLGTTTPAELASVGERLTEDVEQAFADAIQVAEGERACRTKAIATVVAEITALWQQLSVEPESELDRRIAQGGSAVGCTLEVVEQLSARAKELVEEKGRRERMLRELGEAISTLWDRLDVPDGERQRFFDANSGLGPAVIEACEDELVRLRQVLQQSLASLVARARGRIRELWGELHTADDEQAAFAAFHVADEHLTDEVLQQHEAEIVRLQERWDRLRPVLRYIQRREQLLLEREEYDELVTDSSRLLSRRSGKAILEEEKLMRRVTKDLPKLLDKLRAAVREWEAEHGVLMYNGAPFLEAMEAQEAEYQEKKSREKAEKDAKKRAVEDERRMVTSPSAPKKNKFRAAAHAVRMLSPSPSRTVGRTPTTPSRQPLSPHNTPVRPITAGKAATIAGTRTATRIPRPGAPVRGEGESSVFAPVVMGRQ